MKKTALLISYIFLLAGLSLNIQCEEKISAQTKQPEIDVVFVLDTTGSMRDLISAAKEKVWAIANTLAMAKPAPIIRMGLVGYRDRRDEYITKRTDLTSDLDAVYADLMDYAAKGGGDKPESVNQALHEAVSLMDWSKNENAYKVIFLVGDSPPHMDYTDDVKYSETCKKAIEKGIYINSIQCGNQEDTIPFWKEIAAKGEGEYFRVEQSGSAIMASTPYDDELATLSREMDKTRIYYGDEKVMMHQEMRKAKAEGIYAAAPASAKASRAVYMASEAGSSTFAGTQELVRGISSGKVDIAGIKEKELPDNLQKMPKEKRIEYVNEMAKKREEIQGKIKDLNQKRQEHMKKEAEKTGLDKKQSLDSGIYRCIQTQAGKRGIEYKGGPEL
jgi:Mg-chelatase subunit ChlD